MYQHLIENIVSREEGLVKKIMEKWLRILPGSYIAMKNYIMKKETLSPSDISLLNIESYGREFIKSGNYAIIGITAGIILSH